MFVDNKWAYVLPKMLKSHPLRHSCITADDNQAGHAEIRTDPVYGEVIGVRTLPVHAELALIVERRLRDHHPRRQHDERLEAAPIFDAVRSRRQIG